MPSIFKFPLLLISTILIVGTYTEAPAQPATTKDYLDVRLITFSPYDGIFAWFGHTAIEVRNNLTDESYTYSYGGFYFDLKHLLSYGLGRFVFWSYAQESKEFLIPYEAERRHMVFQTLDLTPAQKRRILLAVNRTMLPQNREYVYDHFMENCSTRVRDILDDALDGALKAQTLTLADLSFRGYTRRMVAHSPALDFLLSFLLNDTFDRPISAWNSMFLPDRLMAEVQQATNPNLEKGVTRPLVKIREERNAIPDNPFFATKAFAPNTKALEAAVGATFALIAILAAIAYIRRVPTFKAIYPWVVSLVGASMGTLGVILFFMMCFTNHKDTYWNENIWLMNPLTFLLLPVGIARVLGKGKKLFARLSAGCGLIALVGLGIKVLPMCDQGNFQQIRVVWPVMMVVGAVGLLEIIRERSPHS